jgi:predicted phosphoribosyltransferase
MSRFLDRREAGRVLAHRLMEYAGRPDVIVLGLPRGGVVVAYEVARALGVPLDVFTVRKIGLPWNEEMAVGAIASGGVRVLDRAAMSYMGVTEESLGATIEREQRELQRREQLYRDERPFRDLTGRTVILVDDGLATGSTAQSAVEAVRQHKPAAIVVAVPVASREACARMTALGVKCVAVLTPEPFYGVGIWYYDFGQTEDAEVLALLREAADGAEQPVGGTSNA